MEVRAGQVQKPVKVRLSQTLLLPQYAYLDNPLLWCPSGVLRSHTTVVS